jgi:uncharacterized SAM-binding protein YcdF (DUF218 family)
MYRTKKLEQDSRKELPMGMFLGKDAENADEKTTIPDTGPIEADGQKMVKLTVVRWIILGFIAVYMLIAYFHTPMLTVMGKYLVVSHTAEKSDLIVCLTGSSIERGLATADAYNSGFAPRIFLTREPPPDGASVLRERGLNYPENKDLKLMLLKGLGVPRDVVTFSDQSVGSLFEEAELVKKVVEEKSYRSIIVITSPTHSRRVWLTFRKVFRGYENIKIWVTPSTYSKYNPKDWWKKGPYSQEVLAEYGRLIFNALKYF